MASMRGAPTPPPRGPAPTSPSTLLQVHTGQVQVSDMSGGRFNLPSHTMFMTAVTAMVGDGADDALMMVVVAVSLNTDTNQ